jgi:exosortase/archaeosortase family protein
MLVLLAGFAIEGGIILSSLGEATARLLAVLSFALLRMLGQDIVRDGVELRDPVSDWAVRVSEVCDGIGLMIALIAVIVALAEGNGWLRTALFRLFVGFALIQVFNLIRVVSLALVLDIWPAQFDVMHARVFPYLTVIVFGLVFLPARRVAVLLAGLVVVLLPWAVFGGVLSAGLATLANQLLPLGLPEVGTIALRGDAWSIGTYFLAAMDPVQLYVAPLDPADYLLALPVILVAAAMSGRWLWLVPAVMIALGALLVAAFGAVWTLALSEGPMTLLVPDGEGAFLQASFTVPVAWKSVLAAMQNALVHLLLIVLPVIILSGQPAAWRSRGPTR